MLYCENRCGKSMRERETWNGWIHVCDTDKQYETYNKWLLYCGWDCLEQAAIRKVREQ